MKTIQITTIPGFEEWRTAARDCLAARIVPHDIDWNGDARQSGLFENSEEKPSVTSFAEKVPKDFIARAQAACCHADPAKYALLYRVLWRLCLENRHLLKLSTDDDMMLLNAMVKAVRHDAYKITAFLRFREIMHEGEEHFVAWYEPEHYTLERVLPFFQTRFRNMRWSILTPYRAAHWTKEEIILEDNPDPSLFPKDDQVEQYWLGYYASIFNPARIKKQAMLSQMPKKYWKNMPETALVNGMLRGAHQRVQGMLEKDGALGADAERLAQQQDRA